MPRVALRPGCPSAPVGRLALTAPRRRSDRERWRSSPEGAGRGRRGHVQVAHDVGGEVVEQRDQIGILLWRPPAQQAFQVGAQRRAEQVGRLGALRRQLGVGGDQVPGGDIAPGALDRRGRDLLRLSQPQQAVEVQCRVPVELY